MMCQSLMLFVLFIAHRLPCPLSSVASQRCTERVGIATLGRATGFSDHACRCFFCFFSLPEMTFLFTVHKYVLVKSVEKTPLFVCCAPGSLTGTFIFVNECPYT